MKTLLTLVMLLLFAGMLYPPQTGIARTSKSNKFIPIRAELHTGDIVFRQGKGLISEMFRKSSVKHQQYSHAGIIQITEKGVFVSHMIDDAETKKSNLKTESIEEFCNSNEVKSYAVYRYGFLSGKENMVETYFNNLAIKNVEFDEEFNLDTDNKLYCTELIYKMCLTTANYRLPVSEIKGQPYVALDNLYGDGVADLITEKKY